MEVDNDLRERPMENTPMVSVIINCLNGEAFLEDAVRSVYAQTFTDWEIILYDNGSTDRTPEIARQFDARRRYFRNEETVPLGEARNRAVKESRGEFLAFLDSDDVWFEDKLARQIRLFDDPEVGLAYADVESCNQRGHRRRLSRRKTFHRGYCLEQLITDYFLSMSSVVARRTAFVEQSRWFPSHFQVVEDDLSPNVGPVITTLRLG